MIGCGCGCADSLRIGRVGIGRRGVLRGAGGLLAAGVLPVVPSTEGMSPATALAAMMDGNKRFMQQQIGACQEDLSILRDKTVAKQVPFAAVLACADSRVPVELIFDQSIGHVFVTRVAGNIASADIIASLEYGVAVLGTKTLIVLGHANCGAVKAAMDGKAVPGQISTLYRSLRQAVEHAHHDLDAAIKANAKIQAGLLRHSSPVLGDAVKKGQLSIVSAFYDLGSGEVSLLA
jgi:carbonic anhydrase